MTTPDTVGGLPVSMNPIGYVDLISWQTHWDAGQAFFTDWQDEDTTPIYTQAQMDRAIELCRAAPAGGDRVDGEMFICYLIDKCERETVTEESLHEWLADFLKNPRYHRPSAPAGSGEVEDENIANIESFAGVLERMALCYPRTAADFNLSQSARHIRDYAALLRKLQQGAE